MKNENPSLIALDGLNQQIDGGKCRTRSQWEKWGEKRISKTDKDLGWVCIVGLFDGYFRVNYAAQPINLKVKLNGKIVR